MGMKVEISDRAISTIITLVLSGDPEVERQACCTIANLMEMVELHSKLLQEQGLAAIIVLAGSDDINSKGEACRTLANLAANADVQQQILRFIFCSGFFTHFPLCNSLDRTCALYM